MHSCMKFKNSDTTPPSEKGKQNKQRINPNLLLTLQILWFYAFKFMILLICFIHSLYMYIFSGFFKF